MAPFTNIYGCVSFFGKMSRLTLFLKITLYHFIIHVLVRSKVLPQSGICTMSILKKWAAITATVIDRGHRISELWMNDQYCEKLFFLKFSFKFYQHYIFMISLGSHIDLNTCISKLNKPDTSHFTSKLPWPRSCCMFKPAFRGTAHTHWHASWDPTNNPLKSANIAGDVKG